MGRAPEPTLLSDPRVAAIAVVESGEPLVRLRDTAQLSVAVASPAPPIGLEGVDGTEYAHVRAGLARRLEQAAAGLPMGLRLHVVEGYRPAGTQELYFEAYRNRLIRERPGIGAEASHRLASRFVAPPAVAAHPSGAAVDVTLVDGRGREIDMGTPIDATPEESAGACYLDSPAVSRQARFHRSLLAAILRSAGFVNYPTEWWHWSFGDRYWAFSTGQPAARYGPIRDREFREACVGVS